MDAQRFDALARLCGTRTRRRQLFGGLTTALIAGMARPEVTRAKCKKVGKKCDTSKDCCDHAKCKGKKCKCKGGHSECGGKCYDLDKDEKHCGTCSTACLAGESCVNGVCAEGGCTSALDTCAPSAGCIACPDRPGSVCYLDGEGHPRCSRIIFCTVCESDADCQNMSDPPDPTARCLDCPGQCSGTAACATG